MGRYDWWNIQGEHSAYEWACQRALYNVAPWGERRADLRSAFHTANLMAAGAVDQVPKDEFIETVQGLTNYLPCDQDSDQVDLDALERMKQKNDGNR